MCDQCTRSLESVQELLFNVGFIYCVDPLIYESVSFERVRPKPYDTIGTDNSNVNYANQLFNFCGNKCANNPEENQILEMTTYISFSTFNYNETDSFVKETTRVHDGS